MKKKDRILYLQRKIKKVEEELLNRQLSSDKRLDLKDSKIRLLRELNRLKGVNCCDTNLRVHTNPWFEDKVYGEALHGEKI